MINELNVPQTEWQLGKTKVFLRSVVHEPLEDARKQVINAKATIIQKYWKRYAERRQFGRIRLAVLKIQHAHKGWKLRIEFLQKRRAAIVIQSHLRGVFAREVAAALREMRRVEEEMRKRERLEAERKEREAEQAEADRQALEESERLVQIYFQTWYTMGLKWEQIKTQKRYKIKHPQNTFPKTLNVVCRQFYP